MLDDTTPSSSNYDGLLASKDLFSETLVSTDNYISPKTLCDLIKAGQCLIKTNKSSFFPLYFSRIFYSTQTCDGLDR